MWELATEHGGRYIEDGDWHEVEAILTRLNNAGHAYLSLALEDGTRYLEVYGGQNDRVLVAYTIETDDEDEVVLYDAAQTAPVPVFSAPDNETWDSLPPAVCVSLDLARAVLRHFF